MNNYSIDSSEFDLLMEIIVAVIFMTMGILGIVNMTRILQTQTEVNATVDKVTVSAVDQEESYPFEFTAFQAIMFAWMMDGIDSTSLMWAVNTKDNDTTGRLTATGKINDTYCNSHCILLSPENEAAGFIIKRNRAIPGIDEYETFSVESVIRSAVSESEIIPMYQGKNNVVWKLELTDKHSDIITREDTEGNTYLNMPSNKDLFEERKDYIWTLHPCGH